jgi:glycosyltransferase involved in cell wall biosynthesis
MMQSAVRTKTAAHNPTIHDAAGYRVAPVQMEPKQRIRILHSVGHLLRGGIETWLYQIIKTLDTEQFEHHVLVRTAQEESFTAEFRRAGVQVIPCSHFKNPITYAQEFRRIVRQYGPYQILHVHGSNPNGLMALLLAKPLGIGATIVHSHNDVRPLLNRRGPLYRAYVGLTLRLLRGCSDQGLAASVLAAESMFGKSWMNDKRRRLLYYGIDFKPFAEPRDAAIRAELGIPSDAFVIGHVGRFHEQKNHELLVEIASELINRDSCIHFLLIGEGELRARIAEAIQRRGLSGHFTFVPDSLSVPRLMVSAMDCFVFPSRYEGLGLVAVEAQAAGLPCLLSDRVPEEAVVDPNLVNVLKLEDGAKQWADKIMEMKHGGSKSDSANHLRAFEESCFNLGQNALILAAVYRSMSRQPSQLRNFGLAT